MSTLKAISSMATRHVLAELVAAAHEAGHPDVEIESVGEWTPPIALPPERRSTSCSWRRAR